jgi:thiol-disulfide isomerase/thioredoxin
LSRRPDTAAKPAPGPRRPSRRSALLLAACALGVAAAAGAGTPGEVPVGQRLRDATLQGLNGPPRTLSSFRGRPLIINVWASWCGPCRAETASLERLAWGDAGSHFTVIGISTDDRPQAARAWLKQSNATLSHFIDERLLMEHMLGATHLPLTVLVDADGRVLEKIVGAREWDDAASLSLIARAFGNPRIASRR